MNRSLFRSRWAFLAIATAAVVLALVVLGLAPAAQGVPGARGVRLATGWLLLACMFVVAAYLVRKSMHKRGYSPEFRMRVTIDALERAQVRIAGLRRDVSKGTLASERAVRDACRTALRAEGVQRVLRVNVRPGQSGEPRFVLTTEKTFPLGHASAWIHVHLYVGIAFVLLLVAHGARGVDSALGLGLLGSAALVAGSGLVGIALWATGPRRLTDLERDLSIEEAFALREHVERKLEAIAAALGGPLADRLRALPVRTPDAALASALMQGAGPGDECRAQVEDALVLLGQRARVAAELAKLSRARLSFQAWRAAHLPAVVVLLALVGLHLWTVWRY